MAGPLWSDPIHDPAIAPALRRMLEADTSAFPGYEKVHALLVAVEEELNDVPLYTNSHHACSVLKCTPPPTVLIRSALVNAGYRVSSTHANPLGLKTDAPPGVMWDILRCWVRDHPVKKPGEDTPGNRILGKQPQLEANFARARAAFSKAKEDGVVRFPGNPEAYWGPKMRHGRTVPEQGAAVKDDKKRKR
jgi:tRNA (guanine26-N2/guanine27-N2)-dimethyltransferase